MQPPRGPPTGPRGERVSKSPCRSTSPAPCAAEKAAQEASALWGSGRCRDASRTKLVLDPIGVTGRARARSAASRPRTPPVQAVSFGDVSEATAGGASGNSSRLDGGSAGGATPAVCAGRPGRRGGIGDSHGRGIGKHAGSAAPDCAGPGSSRSKGLRVSSGGGDAGVRLGPRLGRFRRRGGRPGGRRHHRAAGPPVGHRAVARGTPGRRWGPPGSGIPIPRGIAASRSGDTRNTRAGRGDRPGPRAGKAPSPDGSARSGRGRSAAPPPRPVHPRRRPTPTPPAT